MPSRRGPFVALSVLLALVLSPPAWATMDNLKSFKVAYPGKEPKAYSCKVCHQNPIGKKDDLNSYGLALQKLKTPGDAKKLIEEDYRAIEKEDADEDGVSNLDEISASAAPGDPASTPVGAGAVSGFEETKASPETKTEAQSVSVEVTVKRQSPQPQDAQEVAQ